MHHIYNAFYRLFAYMPPSVMAAAALINGITCFYLHNMWALPLFCLLGTEILYRLQQLPRLTTLFMLISVSFCGALRFAVQRSHYQELIHVLPKGLCSIAGTIIDKGVMKSNSYPYYIDVRAHRISTTSHKKIKLDSPLVIRILLQKNNPACDYGSNIEYSSLVIFHEIKEYQTHYYAKHGISCCGKMTAQSTLHLIEPPSLTIAHALYTLKHAIINSARHSFSPTTFTLIATIFFGYTEALDTTQDFLREMFGWWGLNHLLARSGLHLTLFILLLGLLLSLMPFPFLVKHIFIAGAIVMYFLLSWPSVSFIRAACMVGWYSLCVGTFTAAHPLHIIACVVMGTLLYQPYYLFGLDFQLSFSLAFALALIHHSTKIITHLHPRATQTVDF